MAVRTTARRILGAVFALVCIPVVGDFFVEFARRRGVYDNPEGAVSTAVSFVVGIANYWWYPWLVFGVVCFGAGVWLDWLLRRREGRSRGDQMTLADRLDSLRIDLDIMRDNCDFSAPPGMAAIVNCANKFRAVELSLAKMGLAVPKIDVEIDPIGYMERMRDYASRIGPLVADGHMADARREAHRLTSRIQQETVAADLRVLSEAKFRHGNRR
jgi:hypothetical protein